MRRGFHWSAWLTAIGLALGTLGPVAASPASPPERKPFKFEIASPDGDYRLRLGLTAQIRSVIQASL